MSSYTVGIADAQHKLTISKVWARNLDSGNLQHALHKVKRGYLNNPAAAGSIFQLTIDNTSAAIGFVGLQPRALSFNGCEYLAAALTDFAVDSDHRSAGPALMLMREAVQQGVSRFDLVYGLPNAHSHAICRRVGMSVLGTLSRYTLIISSKPKLSQRLHRAILPTISLFLDLILKIRGYWKVFRLRSRVSCRESTFEDEAIDRIWMLRSKQLILSHRASSIIRWRYQGSFDKAWRINIMRDNNNDDVGYVVWRLEKNLAVISDFFTIDPPRLTSAVLLAHAQLAKAEGAHSVTTCFLGSQDVVNEFARAGFFRSGGQADQLFLSKSSSLANTPLSQWYFTDFDLDD